MWGPWNLQDHHPESPESFPSAWCPTIYSFFLFFPPLPPSNWTHLEAGECLCETEISISEMQFSGYHLNREAGKNPKFHVLLCGLFCVFLMNWAETLKLIPDSSQRETATLSLDRKSTHYRRKRPAPGFAWKLIHEDKLLQSLFSANWGFYSWVAPLTWQREDRIFTSYF